MRPPDCVISYAQGQSEFRTSRWLQLLLIDSGRGHMMTYICYTTFMANVKIAYAKAHLPELLARVAQGERIVISRYNTPMAELVPAPKAEKVQRKFGTGKGKAMLIDPRALDPMTDDEAEAFLQGRY